jgi:hypothetical protein
VIERRVGDLKSGWRWEWREDKSGFLGSGGEEAI